MKAGNGSWLEIVLPFVLGVCLLETGGPFPLCAAQSAEKPGGNHPAMQAAPDADEQSALNDAFRSAQGNPQILIKNLEAFLTRFPKSSRRELVLGTICTYALQANAPGVAVQYGQMLLEMTPNDPKLLTMLIDALARQSDQTSRSLAIDYSSRLVNIAENQRTRAAATGVSNNTPEQWAERLAALYAQRAGFYRDSGDLDKAFADDEKSYAVYPTARVAEQLGDAKTFDAVIRNLEVIGEAAKTVPETIRLIHAEVDWKKIAGLRDILIHQYFGVDAELIWDIIQNKLPALEEQIRVIVKS